MFTIEQIERAHDKVCSGADFLNYIREIALLGVRSYETRVSDSRTVYKGDNGFETVSGAKYADLTVAVSCEPERFKTYLEVHQRGGSDYTDFCRQCAETGVDRWVFDLMEGSCTYFDRAGNVVVREVLPQV